MHACHVSKCPPPPQSPAVDRNDVIKYIIFTKIVEQYRVKRSIIYRCSYFTNKQTEREKKLLVLYSVKMKIILQLTVKVKQSWLDICHVLNRATHSTTDYCVKAKTVALSNRNKILMREVMNEKNNEKCVTFELYAKLCSYSLRSIFQASEDQSYSSGKKQVYIFFLSNTPH